MISRLNKRLVEVGELHRVEVATRVTAHPAVGARGTQPLHEQVGSFLILALGRDPAGDVIVEHRTTVDLVALLPAWREVGTDLAGDLGLR